MRQRLAIAVVGVLLAGCATQVAPDVLKQWQGRQLYTCCNLRYEDPTQISDANYSVGTILPFGSPASVTGMTGKSVTFSAGSGSYTVTQSYGGAQETPQQFFAKILVESDPRTRFATYSSSVQAAIRDGRVERGMTRDQVIMSLGYPPTHRTPSTDATTWVYWYNRWVTYNVQFGTDGQVSQIVGTAPTNNQPVQQTVAPAPKPASGKKKKH